MNRKKPTFLRPVRQRDLKEVIFIAWEGAKTEESYADAIKTLFQQEAVQRTGNANVVLIPNINKGNKSAPLQRLRLLKKYIKELPDKGDSNYSAWLVCDLDQWSSEHFKEVQTWVGSSPKHHWILSSPNFEYWLDLHFDNTPNGRRKLREFHEKYDKKVRRGDFSYEQVVTAYRAAKRQYETNSDLTRHKGSQMFLLIKYLAERYCPELGNDFK